MMLSMPNIASFAVLNVIPLIGQSLYWGQGMRSVVPPLILGTAYVGLVLNRSRASKFSKAWFIVASLITCIAAGFAETFFAVETSAIVLALIVAFVTKRRSYLPWLVAGLVGSLLGGLLVFIAPGNKFRQGAFPPPPAIPDLLTIALQGLRQFFQLILDAPAQVLTLTGLALCGFVFGLGAFRQTEEKSAYDRGYLMALIWLPFVAFVLLLACWVPMAYGTSLLLAFRTFIIPAYVLVCFLFCWTYVAGHAVCQLFAQRVWTAALSLIVLIAFGLFAAYTSLNIFWQRSTFANYARRWAEREQTIEQAKAQGLPAAVVLRQHNWAALDEIAVDPKITWLTKCVNDYYSIAVMPDLGDLYGEPDGAGKQAALVQQFDTIKPVADAAPIELNKIYKSDRGKIGFYKSNLPGDQIKSHYDSELARLGWKFIGTKKVEAFQVFSGGTQNLYCNGNVAATLFITGQDEARLGYTYSLALNWGMSSGYVWTQIDCQQ